MKEYITTEGGYASAFEELCLNGGQLFPAHSPMAASVICRGNKVFTYWEPGSPLRAQVRLAAIKYGYDPEHATGGRLARWIIKDWVGIKPSKQSCHPRIRQLAESGHHWHYTHVETGYHPYLIEFDLKSAYLSSILVGDSLFFDYEAGFIDDGGALERLKEACVDLPKFLRMSLIGSLSSHKMVYAIAVGSKGQGYRLQYKSIDKIGHYHSFAACHKGILRLHRVMKKGHEILGSDCKRCHTDSFAIDPSLPVGKEQEFFDHLDKSGFSYSCKAQGSSHFISLNEGIIGRKTVGSKREVLQAFKDQGIKVKQTSLSFQEEQRWNDKTNKENLEQAITPLLNSEVVQIELLTAEFRGVTPHALQG